MLLPPPFSSKMRRVSETEAGSQGIPCPRPAPSLSNSAVACGAPGSTDYESPSSCSCLCSAPSVRQNSRNQKDELRNTDPLQIPPWAARRENAGALPVRVGAPGPSRTCHPVPRWPAPSPASEEGRADGVPQGRREAPTSSPAFTPGRKQVTSKHPDSPRGHRRGRSPDSMLPPRGQKRDGRGPAERAAGRPSHPRPRAGPGGDRVLDVAALARAAAPRQVCTDGGASSQAAGETFKHSLLPESSRESARLLIASHSKTNTRIFLNEKLKIKSD